jgi:hypothetical protein
MLETATKPNIKIEKIRQREAVYFILYAKYCCTDQIKENEMGTKRSSHGEDEECIHIFRYDTRRKYAI